MKIRKGFVSNSSSTSFIVAYKRKDSAEGLCKKVDLNDLIEKMAVADRYSEGTDVTAYGKESVINHLNRKEKLDWRSDLSKKELEESLRKIKEMDETVWEFLFFDLSYHNDVARNILDAMIEQGDVQVFFREDD